MSQRSTQSVDSTVRGDRPAGKPRGSRSGIWHVLVVIACGGALGALARWGIRAGMPATGAGEFPYATLIANGVGGLLIGVLMVLVSNVWTGRPLIRPFFGVGVLGGFTTFSTYIVEIQQLMAAEAPIPALGYLVGTLGAVLLATFLGAWSTRLPVRTLRPPPNGTGP